MKTVSIVGFLVVILFFTGWSMYEDSKKRTVNENFSSELLPWVIECDTSIYNKPIITFSNDTMKIQSPGHSYIWYDRKWEDNYQFSFHIEIDNSANENSWGVLWCATDSGNIENFFKQTESRIGFTPDQLNISSYYFISSQKGLTRFYKDRQLLKESQIQYPTQWISFRITKKEGIITVTKDDETIFNYQDKTPFTSGYSGFYLNRCTIKITNLSFKQLK